MPVYDPDYDVDMTKKPGKQPGLFLAEVTKAERAKSSERSKEPGTPMIVLSLKDVADGKFLCFDRLMLRGGAWPAAYGRLICLGLPRDFKGAVDPDSLIGKRVYVRCIESTFQGGGGLEVDFKGGGHNGYWAESDPPSDWNPASAEALPPIDSGESPF